MIDEEISVPKGMMTGSSRKCFVTTGSTPTSNARSRRKRRTRLFNIIHFAGEVSYNVTGFLEKNKIRCTPISRR